MSNYYDDLSSDRDSSSCSSGSSTRYSSDKEEHSSIHGVTTTTTTTKSPLEISVIDDRCILHVDVDCFYCQCEIQDRQIPYDTPFAIGQKHIIVTCNYAARAKGVKKLQSRTAAYEACPQLIVFEGSDLERYRIYARKIYQTFRKACKEIIHPNVSVRRGSMDEMMADLSIAVTLENNDRNDTKDMYVYGEKESESITLTEDQTGASSKIKEDFHSRSLTISEQTCAQQLQQAARVALRIRQQILQTTGFTTTMGISINPMLAKIASGLKKPATVNVLYPWRSQSLLASMPLRMVPGVGSTTVKALQQCLVRQNPVLPLPKFWTCQDLLLVPRKDIVACLEQMPQYKHSGDHHANIILQKCKGIDPSPILDDEGGAPKTVSVEDSFRRGTLLTREGLHIEMEALYRRLPRLLQERQEWSHSPRLAYPTKIRLTLRTVDENLVSTKRRPFVTRSKQSAFDGKAFVQINDTNQRIAFLREAIVPLLQAFGLKSDHINVTRANIAVTDFQDISVRPTTTTKTTSSPSHQSKTSQSNLFTFMKHTKASSTNHIKPKSPQVVVKRPVVSSPVDKQISMFHNNQIDPSILAQLPPHIIAELQQAKPQKRQRIDDYFRKS